MALPTYDKTKRRKAFQQLPKDAYVIKIVNAKEAQNKKSGSRIDIAFDITEGEYKDFYMKQFQADTREDKKWPNDAIYRLNVPDSGSPEWMHINYNSFFADLEDSNNGFVFTGDTAALKGKLLGAKFHIEQSEDNGNIYDHTRMRFSCVAEDVRQGKAGRLPADKLISATSRRAAPIGSGDDFMRMPEGSAEEIPFD